MYQVFFDGYPLYDPRDTDLIIREPDIHLAVGEAGAMSFTIDEDHPHADKLTRLKGVLEVKADGLPIYKGRIIKDTRDFYLSREITTEGLLSCLNDSIIPPFNFPSDFQNDEAYIAAAESGNVVKFFLAWLLNQHNSQVGQSQRILLGNVTVSDPNNYIHRESGDYLTTMEAVRKKLEDLMGGYLLADYSGETTVLHYYAELPLTNTQVVEYGENLLDLISELNGTDTYTAILPVGADGLTIADLPDGEITTGIIKNGLIIYSQDAEENCGGRITRRVSWTDVTVPSNLQTKAVAQLTGTGVMTSQTIRVTAADLGGTADVSRFVVGRHVQLQSSPHGFDTTFPLMELEPDIFDPGNTKITMGASIMTASDIAHGQQNATQEAINNQQIQLNQQESSITEITQSVTTQITKAVQTCQSIIFSALESYALTSNLKELEKTVSAQLAILAGEVSINLTNTTKQIENVNGDLQAKYESITKAFRFLDDGLHIGESGNEVVLRLDNDVVQFLRNNVPELFMDPDGVHAEELHAKTFRIGRYALLEETDGRLTLRKAVT